MYIPVILLVLLSCILFVLLSIGMLIFLAYKVKRISQFLLWCLLCFLFYAKAYFILFFDAVSSYFHLRVFLIIFLYCIVIPLCCRGLFAFIKKKRSVGDLHKDTDISNEAPDVRSES